jgi:hypothetical protein
MTPATILLSGVAALAALLLSLHLHRRHRDLLPPTENVLLHGSISLTVLLLALALIHWSLPDRAGKERTLFFLVEDGLWRSSPRRVNEERAMLPGGARARFALFGGSGVAPSGERPALPPGPEAAFVSLAGALAWVELEGAGSDPAVAVLSPGPPGGEGISRPLIWRTLGASRAPRRLLEVECPPRAFTGRVLELRATVQPAPGADLLLTLAEEGRRLQERPVVEQGDGAPVTVSVRFTLAGKGVHTLELALEPAGGQEGPREVRHLAVEVTDPPTVHHLSPRGAGSPLAAFLGRNGYRVRPQPASLLDGLRPSRGDVVILEDLPVQELRWNRVARLFSLGDRDGAGLLFVGGRNSYGPGRYADQPVERILPFWMGIKNRDREKHRTALTVILDTSGSMRCPPWGCPSDAERMWGEPRQARGPYVRKIDLATQALLNLLPSLKASDTFGLLGAREEPYWEVEPAPLGDDRSALRERIRGIWADGGGINLYSSIQAVVARLENIPADIRHVVVLLDTDDVDEIKILGVGTVEELAASLSRREISLSFIGFGFSSDRYVPLLNQLATATGGYLYVTSEVQEIPNFLLSDHDRLARRQVIRKKMRTSFSPRELPGLAETPPLEGQFVTEAKPDAVTPIWSDIGYPVFAYRHLGSGVVGGLALDGGGELAPDWLREEALPAWDAVMQRLISAAGERDKVFASRDAEGGEFVYLDAGHGPSLGEPVLSLDLGGGSRRRIPSEEVAAGVHRFRLGPEGGLGLPFAVDDGSRRVASGVLDQGPPREEPPPPPPGPAPAAPPTDSPPGPLPTRADLRFLLILAGGCFLLQEIFRGRS